MPLKQQNPQPLLRLVVIGQFGKPLSECSRNQSRIIHHHQRRLLPGLTAQIFLAKKSW